MSSLSAISPIDGQLLGTYGLDTEADIIRKLHNCRSASTIWASLSRRDRKNCLQPLSGIILARLDELAELIHLTSGKVKTEALLGEIYPVLAQAEFYQKHSEKILVRKRITTSSFSFPDATAMIDRHPFGVIAVIAPWNYPFQLALTPVLTALYAGNGVVLKASEYSLPVAEKIMAILAELKLPEGLVQWIVGAGETGEQLIKANPDLIFFTGGLTTGRRVMALAAEHPIPVILELGGKDAMLVFADADIERVVNAAVYGAFCNSGQVCAGIKRLYVEISIFSEVLERLQVAVQTLRTGSSQECELGAMMSSQHIKIIEQQYDDALAKGAHASRPFQAQGNFVQPIILWNITDDMLIAHEECFGPLLPVMAFNNETHAIQLANQSKFGLNASIWSNNIVKAEEVARQLQTGNWVVNDVIKNIGHPELPFGGVKHSGFGRYHGAEGLLNFTYPVSGLTSRNRLPHEPNWFPYSAVGYENLKSYLDFLFGSGNFFARLRRNQTSLNAFRAYSGLHLKQQFHNLKSHLAKWWP